MANKDYVSRARPANKKNSPYKTKQVQPNGLSLKAKLIAIITLFALGGFSYGLWFIKSQPAPVKIAEPKAVIKTTTSESELPEPPKEVWSYRKELATKEIKAGEYEVKKKGPYKLQCGAFRGTERAERLKAQMAFIGLEPMIKVTTGKNGTIYSVYTGPYTKKRSAEKDKHKLKNNKINYCQIRAW